MDKRADVIVVGGGLAGLTAAVELARKGRSVVVFEKGECVGGRALTRLLGGFHFNVGPHALYRAGLAAAILKDLGVRYTGGVPAAAGGFALAGGRKETLPIGFVSLLTTGLLGLPAKIETARLLSRLPGLDTSGLASVSVADWLDSAVRRPDARAFLAALFRLATYVNDPTRMSAGAALGQVKLALKASVLYLDGGWQTLVDSLRQAAVAHGVRIVDRAPVAGVEGERSAAGVRLAGGARWEAQAVVLATDPATAAALVDARATPLGQWADEAIPVRAACLDVALDHLPRPDARFALGIDAPLYVSVHSAAARLAPAGGALIHVARYQGPEPWPAAAATERELENALDALQPGWRQHVVHRRFVPSLTVSHALPLAERGGLAGRPGPEVPGLERLFVAGDWVGGEGLLVDAALASARRAARAALAATASAAAA